MERVYKVDRVINGKSITDYAVLSHESTCGCSHALHDIGLEYCRTEGYDLYNQEGGLTLFLLLNKVPPELFAKHGITLTWMSEKAVLADLTSKVVGKYEVDTYYSVRNKYNDRFIRFYTNSKKIANWLEKHRASNHPVVSTWDAEKISGKAIMWAREFVLQENHDLELFLTKKLDKAVANMPSNAGAATPSETVPV